MRPSAEFVTSAAAASGFPRETRPEIAMVGRSNVGKSSLINALLKQPLARTSAAPGKTRLANFFRVQLSGRAPFFLVDLPGYGYARAARSGAGKAAERREDARAAFDQLAAEYFAAGRGAVLLLVDSRHPDLDADLRAWAWMVDHGVTVHVVATKVDKLTQAERQRHLGALERRYSGPVSAVSAHTGEGLEALWTQIARLLG
ncbi:MAG: ribosome biogenesis GTP-binding protein YsxC [Acidobacteria bacterium]|nr:ribosome biogenesis GTP-binding protein YsxC [Acidobacteriota bacterium]